MALLLVSCELLESQGPNDPNTPDTPNTEEPSEEEPDEENPVVPEIRLDVEGVIAVAAAGGDIEVEYDIVNPVDGAKLDVKADVAWIKDFSVAEKVTFSVEANDGVSRFGVLTFTYADVEVAVAVQQTEFLEEGVARLSVTSDLNVAIAAEGGSGKIIYLLECDDKEAMPTVEADVKWIVIDAVESKRVKYTVEANNVEEARVGHVTLSYEEASVQVTIEQDAAMFFPVLIASDTTVKLNESVEFTVMYGDKDITAEAEILKYDTNANVGPTFEAKELGEHNIYAKYNNRDSEVVSIYVSPLHAPEFPEDTAPERFDFNQRFLLVDHTGIECPNCPAMKRLIKDAEEGEYYNNKFNVVYAYSYTAKDPCYTAAANTLWDYYKATCIGLTGFPSATFNYQYLYPASSNNLIAHIKNVWSSNPSASVALAVDIKDNQLVASVAVKSSKEQNIKLSLWVLEDGITAAQYGATEEWMNHHHNVLRECPTGISNSDISGVELGDVKANGVLRAVVDYELNPASSWVVDNYKVIAIISAPSSKYDNKYEVLNTAICEVGSFIGFDYK